MNDALPDHGLPREEVLAALQGYAALDPDYKGGRLWSLAYWLDEAHHDFMGRAYQAFAPANGLNPAAFKSLRRFEREIVQAVARLHHGAPEVCGVLTSGGTESCLMAVKAYRDLGRARRIRSPRSCCPPPPTWPGSRPANTST